MRIGVLGAGEIGGTVAALLGRAGHEVALANSRGPDSLAELVAGLGGAAKAETVSGAVAFGDVVILAIPFGRYAELPAAAFAGKIVVDTTNYTPGRDGRFPALDSDRTTSSRLVAEHLAGATVVKSINTLNYRYLIDRATDVDGDRLALFVAGDDDAAKSVVANLVADMGFTAVDTGSLDEGGRRQQPGTPVFNVPLSPAELPFTVPVPVRENTTGEQERAQ